MSTNKPTKINQKEYLKKYLSGDKTKKKKDKKHKVKGAVKVKIIDDDVNTLDNGVLIDEELLLTGDDAPQIVGEYVEDRSQEGVSKWRSINVKEEKVNVEQIKIKTDFEDNQWGCKAINIKNEIKIEPTSPLRKNKKRHSRSVDRLPQIKRRDSDQSPVRNSDRRIMRRRSSSVDLSPRRRRSDRDQLPPRKSAHSSSRRCRNSSEDISPRRRNTATNQSPLRKTFKIPERRRRNSSTDLSPRRKRYHNDQSPPRKRAKSPEKQRGNSAADLSPRRRPDNRQTSPQIRKKSSRRDSQDRFTQRRRDSDQSPPRKSVQSHSRRDVSEDRFTQRRRDSDQSPPRKSVQSHSRYPSNASIEKQLPRIKDCDLSETIKREKSPTSERNNYRDQSPPRRRRNDSPNQSQNNKNGSHSTHTKQSRWDNSPSPPPTHKPKDIKTLDGKKAGLQDAKALKAETEERRRKEEKMFAKMSNDVSGRNAEVQVRNTGRRGQRARDAKAEDPEVQRQKAEREQKKKELYERWGKGLKQIEDHRARVAEQNYESSKPLARYANDDDLEQHLRDQERLDDPMLEYMRRKKKEQQKQGNAPTMPRYEGSFPENRFGIRPGYRWDGVDRSNGYEKKWFDEQNKKRALQDEAYKYSVEDM